MSLKILVMSCDKNQDLFAPFHYCMEKYWKDHPEIIYSTETVVNPYYKTICKNLPINKWTKRVWETINEIKSSHIILTIDDLFIRDYVDNDKILELCGYIRNNIAAINLEFAFDKNDFNFTKELKLRNPTGKFKLSCMCQIWQKGAMLNLFNVNNDPWRFEKNNNASSYDFLISKDGNFINWGKRHDTWKWGIVRGKWTYECKEFFEKEGIEIDYSTRGFIDG